MSSASAGQETPPAVIHAVAAQVFKLWVLASFVFVIFLYWNKATKCFCTNWNNFPLSSVNGQYASQGKLGAAVLGSHNKKEVITHNCE